MNEEATNELNSILVGYRTRLLDKQGREAAVKLARAAFVEAFRTLKAERIGPVLEEFVVQLNANGHQASVVDQHEASDRNGQFTPASIALRIVPARMGDTAVLPSGITRVEVSFSANQHTMKVLVSSTNNANGTTGRRGDYDLPEITTEFIESNVLKTIREAFAISK